MNRYEKYSDSELSWEETIPEHWDVKRIARVFDIRKEKNFPIKTKEILSLSAKYGVSLYSDKKEKGGNKPKEDLTAYNLCYPGDILINCMNVVAGSVGISNYFGAVSPVYYPLVNISQEKNNTRYMEYVFRNYNFQRSLVGLGKGIQMSEADDGRLYTVRMRISWDMLKTQLLPIPPINEQEQIANYLDWKINEINKLIKIENEKIKLLNELLAKEIENLIFNNSDKASNSNWYQSVPMLSEEIKIKFIFSLRDERNHLPESDVDLISLYTKWGVILNEDIEIKTGNKNTTVENYKKVYEDDIVVNIMLCWMGAIGVSKYNGVTSPAYDIYKPNLDLVVPKYYHYMFRTNKFRSELFKKGKGIVLMKWRVYSDKFKNIIVPLPEISEQKRIVELIEEKQKIALGNISIIKEKLTELKNLKQALISEIVTGKIDVRNIVIPEYEKVIVLDDETEEFDEMEGIEDGD